MIMSTTNQGTEDEEMYHHGAYQQEQADTSNKALVVTLLTEYKTWIGAIAVVGITALIMGWASAPQWMWVYGVLTVLAVLTTHLSNNGIVDRITDWDPYVIYNPGIGRQSMGLYRVGEDRFRNLVVCGGDEMFTRKSPILGRVYIGTDVRELEEGEEDHAHPLHEHKENDYKPVYAPKTATYVNTTWHSKTDPVELDERKHKLDEAMTDLSILANKSIALKAKQSRIVGEKVRTIVSSILRDIDGATLPHNDEVSDVVEREMRNSTHYDFVNAGEQAEVEGSKAREYKSEGEGGDGE